jgi:ArsR family transcriptional regulator
MNYSKFFKVLSDPTRLNIIMLLTEGELCVCQIEEALNAKQAKISRHLAYLRKHKIVRTRSQWKWKYYSLMRPKNRFEKSVFKCLKVWLRKEKPFRSAFAKMADCTAASKRSATLAATKC